MNVNQGNITEDQEQRCKAMMVVCNGHVCEMYTLKDGTICYKSYATGKVIKREKPTKKKEGK